MKKRQQYRMLQAAFVFALIGIAFFAAYAGHRAGNHPANQYAYQDSAKAETAKVDQPRGFWGWLTHDATGVFTIALCVITGTLAWFTYRLFAVTSHIARDGKKSAEQQLRAYVCQVDATLRNFQIGQCPRGIVKIINAGATPAHALTTKMAIALVTAEEKEDFEIVVPEQSKMALGPRIELAPEATLPKPLTKEQYSAVIAGRQTLFVWGEVSYLDAFDVQRETIFRFRYRKEAAASGSMILSVCPEGNKAT